MEKALVATGAASRLRLKHCFNVMRRNVGLGGNRGGFSFEIETHPKSARQSETGTRGNRGGFSFEIETKRLMAARASSPECGNRGGFSFEIETHIRPAPYLGKKEWQPGRLLV